MRDLLAFKIYPLTLAVSSAWVPTATHFQVRFLFWSRLETPSRARRSPIACCVVVIVRGRE
ncbi:hypothetical protein BU23DRAFT_24685 [Bimuria novae-zelandiae CBS 107.79]|uniref:Uncharacterized protein n=1 Tax=Bimuria novae-zelandiae CBS 107.79 TaxID=1447943 RepID=A0A6A5UKQ1_9PLEO|nr:hypothetical protein BU23DRAFT_24685 [Bimuria novae-zelandiae CBS 107.79]